MAKLTVAHEVCRLWKAAGLTQAQLARRVGVDRAVIGQLEGVDYEGDSLAMRSCVAAGPGQSGWKPV